ncbi:hypothetical protein L1049_007654 [Liquidambar formosana]|uniref:Protein LURP-one-related 10-like n=1 Tax=Liquidambar formosana TaxID=63359 RepID=A0AAP0S4K1_LIQFO
MNMAESSYLPLAKPVAVISPQYCAPYPVDLMIVRKLITITDGNFAVTDANGNIIFQVKGTLSSLRDRRVLLDAAGNPIISLQQKIFTAHRRWQVYREESSDAKDLLFSAKKSSHTHLRTELDVFLASNTKEEVCDFKIKGSWLERSCIIYTGDSSTVIAQMHHKRSVQSVVLGKDTFTVTVYPNIDYAFIVALVVILEEINEEKDD